MKASIRNPSFKVVGQKIRLSHDYVESKSCSHATYQGKLYTVGDYILSNCLQFALRILEIGVNDIEDQMVLVTGIFKVSFNNAFRMYKLGENIHENECKLVNQYLILQSARISSVALTIFIMMNSK